MTPQHFVSISGGKDSTAVACLAVERLARRPFPARFMFADTGNEHPATIEHVAYLGRALGITIETVKADFSDDFAARRATLREEWGREKRRTRHTKDCNERRAAIPKLAPGCRHSPERSAALRDWARQCECPVVISPPVPDALIEAALVHMVPTGIPLLDVAMLKGRFPGAKVRFCTEDTKLAPMNAIKHPLLDAGTSIVEWIGERADESAARAKKPAIERVRWASGATKVLFRPIHALTAADTFVIAKRHGLKPNPLYLQGMSRVGCMPCIMAKKGELAEIARRFPEHVDRIREWEQIVGRVSRHALMRTEREGAPLLTSFMPADLVPDNGDQQRAQIDKAIGWAKTSRGGRQIDLLGAIADAEAEDGGLICDSAYGLCE